LRHRDDQELALLRRLWLAGKRSPVLVRSVGVPSDLEQHLRVRLVDDRSEHDLQRDLLLPLVLVVPLRQHAVQHLRRRGSFLRHRLPAVQQHERDEGVLVRRAQVTFYKQV
jgi:hypothetical protein